MYITFDSCHDDLAVGLDDAAFLFLALYRYKEEPGIDPALKTATDLLLERFDFAAFSSPGGWKLAYDYDLGAFTAAMFAMPVDRIEALSDISKLFYISGAGIVGAFMGATAWMSKK